MAIFNWRGIGGSFALANDWIETTTGANPAPVPPGSGDVAILSGAGNFVSGNGTVQTLDILQSSNLLGWVFSGALTAQSTAVSGDASFQAGARLTLTGIPAATGLQPYAGYLNAYVLLNDATLDSSAAPLDIGSASGTPDANSEGDSLQITSGSVATALALNVGLGVFASVQVTGSGSTLTTLANPAIAGAGQLVLGAQRIIGGVTTSAGLGSLLVNSGGAVTIGNGLNDGDGGAGSLFVTSGGSVTVSSGFSAIGNIAGGLGDLTVSGGTFTLAGGQLAVGNRAGASGLVDIAGGGQFLATEAAQTASYIVEIGNQNASGGLAAASGTLTVEGQGSLLDLGQNALSVGYYGVGVLNVMSGGVVRTVTTTFTDLSSLAVGRFGSGTVNIAGSGSVISATGGLYDGRAAGGVGVINVTSGGQLRQFLDQNGSGGIGIGQADTLSGQQASGGTGTLDINTSGAVFGAGFLTVGNNGCTGFVALDTGGSLTVAGQIAVGTGGTYGNGNGTVTISGGAGLHTSGPHATQSAGVTIANQATTSGSITVHGGGSVLDAGGDRIAVGSRGAGTLLVQAGATASAGNTFYSDTASEAGFSVGTSATGSGAVDVDGVGSQLVVNGGITLAGGLTSAGGTATLALTSGAEATGTGLVLWSGGTLSVDGASLLQIGGSGGSGTGIAVQSDASLTAHGGAIAGAVGNAGILSNDGSLTVSGSVTGSGTLDLLAGSTTRITGSIAGQHVSFADATGLLYLTNLAGSASVTAAQAGDVIDLLGITNVTTDGANVTTDQGALNFTNLAAGLQVVLSSDAQGGTDVGVACYCAGTLIQTDGGEIAVERLAIGDRVVTVSGASRAIRWVGRRSYAGRFLAGKPQLLPILFRAGCLGEGLPRRDLRVSPLHAMYLDGVLVPTQMLVNRTTIVQVQDCNRVDYVHVELDSHDVILAEGAPSETFLDDDSRWKFHNASEYAALYPGAAAPGIFCAPCVMDGYQLDGIQRRLAGVVAVAAQAA